MAAPRDPQRLRKSLARDGEGAALMFAALFLPVLLIVAAFAIDLSYGHFAKERMKFAADAAATGAALALPNADLARHIARQIADANGGTPTPTTISADSDIQIGVFDTQTRQFTAGSVRGPDGSESLPNAIQVTASRTAAKGNAMPAFFSGILGKSSIDVAASSVAVQVAPPCVVTLDPGEGAYTQMANSEVVIPACGLHVNGRTGTSLNQAGFDLRARTICAVGGASGRMTPKARTGCPPLRDPMAEVPEPVEQDCRQMNPAPGFHPSPNCTYSGTIVLAGNIQLERGIYDFRSARVVVAPGAEIEGKEVMFFLDQDSILQIEPNTKVNLAPLQQGPYAGMTLFQSRKGPSVSRIIGTGDTNIFGTIYMPQTLLEIGGRLGLGKTVVARIEIQPSAQVLFNHWMGTNAVPALSATNVRTTIVH